jgi:hypothetical protein
VGNISYTCHYTASFHIYGINHNVYKHGIRGVTLTKREEK